MKTTKTTPTHASIANHEKKLRSIHWQRSRYLILFLVGILGIATIALLSTINILNDAALFGFPLGYFLIANGLLILCITSLFWAAMQQEWIDRTSNLTEDQ